MSGLNQSELWELFRGNAMVIVGGIGAAWCFVLGWFVWPLYLVLFVWGLVVLVRAFKRYQWANFVAWIKAEMEAARGRA